MPTPEENSLENQQNRLLTELGIKMVFVEGGSFMMGYDPNRDGEDDEYMDDSKPLHEVTLSDYWVGKYPITQKTWQGIMDKNPSYFKGENLPVEQVSWDNAMEFIEKLNQRSKQKFNLPTEAQWEYAARGGNKSKGFMYAGSNKPDEVAWHRGNSGGKTHPSGCKKPNELGIYDMSGNVREWCLDYYDPNYYALFKSNCNNYYNNNKSSDRCLRGSSWNDTDTYCRLGYRGISDPYARFNGHGFRLFRIP
jgi:formylglycine-generating enzyme required for sulfatase activity